MGPFVFQLDSKSPSGLELDPYFWQYYSLNTFLPFSVTDIVPATDTSFKVSMSPWSNYTFRVIARNKVGESLPSGHSKTCLTPEDVPFKNPDNVEGRGTTPTNLVISWTVSFYFGGIT